MARTEAARAGADKGPVKGVFAGHPCETEFAATRVLRTGSDRRHCSTVCCQLAPALPELPVPASSSHPWPERAPPERATGSNPGSKLSASEPNSEQLERLYDSAALWLCSWF